MTNTDNHSQSQQTDGIEQTIEASANAPGTHPQANTEHKQRKKTGRADVFMLLLAVLLIGAYFRLLNVDWDEGEHLHPDERYMTMVTGAIRSPGSVDAFQNLPDGCVSWGSYFDSYCSPLNPYNHQGYGSYAYGTFPLFSARIVGEWLNGACADSTDPDTTNISLLRLPQQWVARLIFRDTEDCTGARFTTYGHLHILGRILSALADLGTLLFLFLIGRRLYGPWVGLLAAALYALAALPIQQSHFYTVDSFATFWIAAAGYFAVRIAQHGRWRDFILAGLCFGLALASKVSVWPFAAVIVLAALLIYVRSRSTTAMAALEPQQQKKRVHEVLDWLMILVLIILFFLIGAIALFGIWSAVKIAFFFAIAMLALGGIAFYILRPGDIRASDVEASQRPISVDGLLLRLLVAGFVTFFAFRVAQPYAFVGTNFDTAKWDTAEYQWLRGNVPEVWYTLNERLPGPLRALLLPDPRFISTLGSVNKQLTGEADVPWGHQWTNRVPFVFPWKNMVFWGMGLVLGLIVWTAWAVAGWELWQGKRRLAHFIPWAWITLLFFYQGTQWVKSIRYLLPIYPYLILLGAWLLVRLWRKAKAGFGIRDRRSLLSQAYRIPLLLVLLATLLWAWGFTRIYMQPVTRNSASRWMVDNIPTAATLHYEVNGEVKTQHLRLPPTYTYANSDHSHIASFVLPEDGKVTGVTFTHLGDPALDAAPESFQVVLAADAAGQNIIARAERTINLEQSKHRLGDAQHFPLGPIQMRGDQEHFLITQALEGAPIQLNTTVIANEYPDDSLPTRVDGLDPFGTMYRGLQSSGDGKTHWDLNEDPSKLSQALEWLDEADIIALSSNRGYASIPRLPSRYPMAIEFYRALFAEELGYEFMASFTSYPTIGPFQFPDQETPFPPGKPALLRDELGSISVSLPPAEEAFSVYDHPQVFLFQKSDDYSRQTVEEVLSRINLDQTVWMKPTEATLAPTALMHTAEESAVQRSGGTWTDIFDADAWLNRLPMLSVVVWYLLIMALGMIVFPLLFFVVPGLPDRGWPLARTLGLLLLAFLVWVPASSSLSWSGTSALLTYSRSLILVVMLFLTIVGGLLAWWQRREIVAWLKKERRAIAASELIFAILFSLFLLIRFANPDLWHPVMGGERPMDFAYLNAVLKSSKFPPYDPWFAGGYMNYYYFGFVIAGTPVKLLGILPEIAYNLILPTFFALTGAGAFSIAYNLVKSAPTSSWTSKPASNTDNQTENAAHRSSENKQRASSLTRYAICAGVLAAVFVTVLGNLAEIKLVADGLTELGSRDFDFQSTIPGLEPLVISARGLVKHAVGGEPMPWRPEWPYWNASRAIPHPEGEAPPITEFPFFTFLYSDLHAHLLVLPLTLLALAFLLEWVVDREFWDLHLPDRSLRWKRRSSAVLGLIIAGIVIGSLRPTNTWDYVTYLALVPLALAIGYGVHRFTRQSSRPLLSKAKSAVAAIGGRFAIVTTVSFVGFLPYITRYATASTGFDLWKGSKTPLWAYFGIHGLFLFTVITWLVIRLTRHLISGRASQRPPTSEETSLPEEARSMNARVFAALAVVLLLMLFAVMTGFQVAVIVLPFGIVSLLVLIQRDAQPAERLVALLVGVALGLTLLVEALVLNQGDVGRMNTVFKFYLQAWVLFGVAAAASIVWTGRRLSASLALEGSFSADPGTVPDQSEPTTESSADRAPGPPEVRSTTTNGARVVWKVWKVILALLVALAVLYPILATRAKIYDRWSREVGPGLDGLEWMKRVNDVQFGPGAPEGLTFSLLWDYQALMWLRENIEGSPVVVEGANAPPYRSLRGRVATYTGLPIVIGYPWHQKQQRSFVKTDVIGQRERDVDNLYNTTDPWLAKEILDRYDVSLLYVGDLERVHYAPGGIAKFTEMSDMGLLHVIYSNEGVIIYEVVR